MKYLTVALILAGFISVPATSEATTHQVDMQNFAFDPETLAVNQGDSVLWINQTGIIHTTTSGIDGAFDGYWDSGDMVAGDSFAFVFDSLGTFPYFCRPHFLMGMVGVIFVNPVGVEEMESGLPQRFQVNHNFPNPFNSSTKISFELHTPAVVEIKIYNVSGQFVKKLIDQFMVSGKYSVVWNGVDSRGEVVPTGTYIYQLKFDNTIIGKQILLLR